MQEIRVSLKKQIKDSVKLGSFLDQVQHNVLEQLDLFTPSDDADEEAEATRRLTLAQLVFLLIASGALALRSTLGSKPDKSDYYKHWS